MHPRGDPGAKSDLALILVSRDECCGVRENREEQWTGKGPKRGRKKLRGELPVAKRFKKKRRLTDRSRGRKGRR